MNLYSYVPLVALLVACNAAAPEAAPASPAELRALSREQRESFFYALHPGVRLSEVRAALGEPDTFEQGAPAYRLPQGRVTVQSDGEHVLLVQHHEPGDCVSQQLYHAAPGATSPTPEQLLAREERIGSRALDVTEGFGPGIWVHSYDGLAYLLEDGYLVIEPIARLMGAWGAFAELTARATVYRAPPSEDAGARVLWRASDHWEDLRPPGLSDSELDRRERVLRTYLAAPGDASIVARLGSADGGQGSGRSFLFYYVRGGLVTILEGYRGESAEWGGHMLHQPGADDGLSLAEWLAGG